MGGNRSVDSRHFFGLLMLLSTSVLVGCGPTKPLRVPVYGQVSVNGRTAEDGVVRFVPVGDKDKEGPKRPSEMATIVGGKYQVESGGGLRQGRYRVEVEVDRKTGKQVMKRASRGDVLKVDETVLVSPPRYAGKDSPLEYTADASANRRFDIDVPAK